MFSSAKIKVVICGKTGAGKTSLIRAVTGDGCVPDDAIGHSAPKTRGFREYANGDFLFVDTEGFENCSDAEYKRFIASVEKHVVMLYCIDGSGARVQKFDDCLINFARIHGTVIVVFTKKDTMRENQKEAMSSALSAPVPFCFVSEKDQESVYNLKKLICGQVREIAARVRAEIRRWENMPFADVAKCCKWRLCPDNEYAAESTGGGFNEKDSVVLRNRSRHVWLRLRFVFRVNGKTCTQTRDGIFVTDVSGPPLASSFRLDGILPKTFFFPEEMERCRLWVVTKDDAEKYRENQINELKDFRYVAKKVTRANETFRVPTAAKVAHGLLRGISSIAFDKVGKPLIEDLPVSLECRSSREAGLFLSMDDVRPGTVVICALAKGVTHHSGVWLGDGRVAELDGNGNYRAVTLEVFIRGDVGESWRSGSFAYAACGPNGEALGDDRVAMCARGFLGHKTNYSVDANNCHRFSTACHDGGDAEAVFRLTETFSIGKLVDRICDFHEVRKISWRPIDFACPK